MILKVETRFEGKTGITEYVPVIFQPLASNMNIWVLRITARFVRYG